MLEGSSEECGVADFDLALEGPTLEHDYLCMDDPDPMLTSSLSKSFDADAKLNAVIDDVASADVPQFVNILNEDITNLAMSSSSTIQQKWLSESPPSLSRKKATIVKCEYCGVVLKHPSKIEAHRRTHTGEKPFQCQICGSRFTQRTPMRMHVRRHMGLTPFLCSYGNCGKRFVSNALKNAHELKTHMGAKRRGPPRPHLKPPRRSVPMQMLEDNGEAEEVGVSGCEAPQIKPNSSNFAPEGRKTDEINGEDVTSSSLPSEQRNRTRRKRALVAQCQECGLFLKHPSKIQAHMRTHTGERPFECGLCGMRFATANPLRVHFRRAHTGEKPFECTWECGRRFVSVSARNEHERIVHAGVKRYHCTINDCHRMFTRRRYLIMHQAKEHKDITEQADNAIQCVLNMVKQEREEARRNALWPHEMPDCTQKVWNDSGTGTDELAEEQNVDSCDENGDGLLECADAAADACRNAKEEDDLLNVESYRQVIIDGAEEDAMSEDYLMEELNEVYYIDQNDEIQLEDSAQQINGEEFMGEIGPSVIPVRTEAGNIYTICEESTAVLPIYGRIRIIKPIAKRF